MKPLLELIPVILFVVAWKIYGIYVATAVMMTTTSAQLIWSWLRYRKVSIKLKVTFYVIMVLGGATLYLHNPIFVKWKPTIIYWVGSLALFLSPVIFNRNLVRDLLKAILAAPDAVWTRVNIHCGVFLILIGALNLFVAYNYSEKVWMSFKVIGTPILLMVFSLAHLFFLFKYLIEEPVSPNEHISQDKIEDKQ